MIRDSGGECRTVLRMSERRIWRADSVTGTLGSRFAHRLDGPVGGLPRWSGRRRRGGINRHVEPIFGPEERGAYPLGPARGEGLGEGHWRWSSPCRRHELSSALPMAAFEGYADDNWKRREVRLQQDLLPSPRPSVEGIAHRHEKGRHHRWSRLLSFRKPASSAYTL